MCAFARMHFTRRQDLPAMPNAASPSPQNAQAKAAQKKARMAAKKLPPPVPEAHLFRTLPLFDGVSNKWMDAVIEKAEGKTYLRDEMVQAPGALHAGEVCLNFVVAGQFGVGEHTAEAQKAVGMKAKAEVFKKVGQTTAVFGTGDFFADDFAENDANLCIYSITEAQVLRISLADLEALLQKHSPLKERLRKHAESWLDRFRIMREDAGRSEIFDFYVKNGFSFSTRTKIRQLELCIDCDKCVQGCEERHGFPRLERFGPQVGLINFSVSCRQCYDPRCLSDCNFDAIARDNVSHEIRVNMEDCTGCGVCARGCPNDAIFVHAINESVDTSIWDDIGKKVPKKVAVKCDRCAGYDDMACISACPTGAMVDAAPELIFGLDVNQTTDLTCDSSPFEEGWSTGATARFLPRFLYGTSILILVACLLEWIFRRWIPENAFMPFFVEELNKRLGEGYDSGRGLGLWFGIFGASAMCATLIYVIRNRFDNLPGFFGGKYFWFSFHNALGVLGPALIFLHGNLMFSKWPAVGVWASLLVVASGFLGQYLANQIPGKQFKNTRERQELNRNMQSLSQEWGEHTRSVNVAEMMLEFEKEKASKNMDNMGTFRFLLHLVTADIHRMGALLKLRIKLRSVKNKEMRKQLHSLKKEELILEQQDTFFKTAGRLMSQWRLFHIFFSIGIFLLMALHVGMVIVF
ncbi:MAG: hypothetical protein GY822_09570 [Deltaproteobacteria bacterium]|nr:hypothetical protein [Deltaproteobacteria bacterium]